MTMCCVSLIMSRSTYRQHASRLMISEALHLNIFEQPVKGTNIGGVR